MSEAHPMFNAREKLAFLLAFVPYLADKSPISVNETAQHFAVTPAFIREAVRLIAVSGIPGETRSYQHEDLFDIAWDAFETRDEIILTHRVAIDDSPRFSAREAAALIAGLQYLSALPENADREVIAHLMEKLSRGASSLPSELAVVSTSSDATVSVIRSSLETVMQLEFNYLNSRGEHERRRVDPIRVQSVDRDWYLRAWDHLRNGTRTFRIDRMSDATITNEPASARAASEQIPETLFEPSSDDLTVEVEIAASALPLFVDWIPPNTEFIAHDTVVDARIRVAHYHGLKRLAAQHSGVLRVNGPAAARHAIAEWARAGALQYETSPQYEAQ